MKLSPPASSSDLEVARDIARRLHQRRRREDRPDAAPAPPEPVPPPRPLSPPAAAPEAYPEPPSWDEPVGERPSPPTGADEIRFDEPAPSEEPTEEQEVGPPPDIEIDDEGVSPEQMVGGEAERPFEELVEPPPADGETPFEVELDGDTAEEVFESPPSWDDIVEICLGLAQARGAMLVDPAGQVFSARGEWPAPGPEAIATKLVSTMDRTLKDAPTRSISAPLMGMHLTAWRVPLAEGLVTAAFIADSPVRAESRPAIDAEIHRGAGA